jgi:GT2 family glycosyltransferase
MPCVSVIIPTYNRKTFVQETIDSVLAQTYTDYEIIVVDDGSTDDTGTVLRSRYGDRIHYLWQENQGESAARNHGINLAQGEYIAFLDSDDVWLPDKLRKQVTLLEANSKLALLFCQAQLMDTNGNDLKGSRLGFDIKPEDLSLKRLYFENTITAGGSTVLVRRAALIQTGGFDLVIQFGEDWDLWLRLRSRWEFGFLPEPLARIRRHRNTQCYFPRAENIARTLEDHLRMLEKVFADRQTDLSYQIRAPAMAWQYFLASLAAYAVQETKRADEWLKFALSRDSALQINDKEVKQQIINHALAVAESIDGQIDSHSAAAYVRQVCGSWRRLGFRTPFGFSPKILASLYVELGFTQQHKGNLKIMRHYFLLALVKDPAWLKNIGLLFLIVESMIGARLTAQLRKTLRALKARVIK